MILQNSIFTDNNEKGRFELKLNASTAFVRYIRNQQKIIIFNTEIPSSISEVEYIAVYLMTKIVDLCNENKEELDIRCPFARAIISKMKIEGRKSYH